MTGEGLSFDKWAKRLNGPHKDFQDHMLGSALYVMQAQGIAPPIAYEYLRNLTLYLLGRGPAPESPAQEVAHEESIDVASGVDAGRTIWTPGGEHRVPR